MNYITSHKVKIRRDIVPEKDINFFHNHIDINFLNGCWEWTGARSRSKRKGEDLFYGYMNLFKRLTHSHRASWIIHFGYIPKGKFVCHKCDNPICCNPDHLFLGTQKDNMVDKIKKGRQNLPRGQNHHRSVLSEKDVKSIKTDLLENKKTVAQIARDYCVSRGCIDGIKEGKNWSWIK